MPPAPIKPTLTRSLAPSTFRESGPDASAKLAAVMTADLPKSLRVNLCFSITPSVSSYELMVQERWARTDPLRRHQWHQPRDTEKGVNIPDFQCRTLGVQVRLVATGVSGRARK